MHSCKLYYNKFLIDTSLPCLADTKIKCGGKFMEWQQTMKLKTWSCCLIRLLKPMYTIQVRNILLHNVTNNMFGTGCAQTLFFYPITLLYIGFTTQILYRFHPICMTLNQIWKKILPFDIKVLHIFSSDINIEEIIEKLIKEKLLKLECFLLKTQ